MGDLSVFKDKKFKSDEAYNDIQRSIKLNKKHVGQNNIFLCQLLKKKLIPEMDKHDPLFKRIFCKIMYGGSYYKRLKVCEPDEYDINLVMKFPVGKNHLQICCKDKSGFVTLNVSKSLAGKKLVVFQRFFEESSFFLDQKKFHSWFQGVFDKAINNLKAQGFEMKHGQSGPAFTLYLQDQNRRIDIDVAPALEFVNMPIADFDISKKNVAWLALAKPLSAEVEKHNVLWRVDFYEEEKRLFKGQIQIKPIIRTLKKLRDFHNWTFLRSYAIETLCMNELENEVILEHLQKSSRTKLLFYMMQVLHRSLENNDLPNFWNEKQNLLSKSNEHIYKDMAKQLQRIMNDIQDNIRENPKILIKYFLTEKEQENLITKKMHTLTMH